MKTSLALIGVVLGSAAAYARTEQPDTPAEELHEMVIESPSCRNAEMLSILIKTWHDIKSMEGHDEPKH